MEKEKLIKKVIEINKIKNLNPIQKEAIKMGILEGKSLIVASPTSSGKTLLAELAGLNIALNQNKKMIYLCPLVALAREKYKDFKKKYEKLGVKIALSIGGFDSADPWLKQYSWGIFSNEKFDSLIRHEANWISNIGLTVVDEIHLINDPKRGPTLEILLTILKEILPKSQILALSATIKNVEEIGEWLGADVLKSGFRPVPLYHGIFSENKIRIFGKRDYLLKKDLSPEEAIVENTISMKKQLIFFLSTRRNAEALAERLSRFVSAYLDLKEKKELEKLAQKIERALEIPTTQCKRLANCIRKGVAFYHAGLVLKQKILIEEAYKNRILKVVTSTTSLALGVNLPNFRSVVRDVKRFYPGMGSIYIPVLEVHQMFGRSGRIGFDKWGEGILVAKSKMEKNELKQIYIKGEIEEISSKISNESALRMHILSLISNKFCKTQEGIFNFFKKTFFGKKFKDISQLKEKIENIIFLLESWNFIKIEQRKILATRVGKRISELYLDPLTANLFIERLKNFKKANDFTLFCLLAKATELKPSPVLSGKDYLPLEEIISKNEESFLFSPPDEFDENYEEFLKEAKLALIFLYWINEESEEKIMENFNLTPGELHSRLEISDWLFYGISELGKILDFPKELIKKIRKLRFRAKYGIKEELIALVKIKGIGRVRARLLFNEDLKSILELKKAPIEKIAKILKSKTLAKKIKAQLDSF